MESTAARPFAIRTDKGEVQSGISSIILGIPFPRLGGLSVEHISAYDRSLEYALVKGECGVILSGGIFQAPGLYIHDPQSGFFAEATAEAGAELYGGWGAVGI